MQLKAWREEQGENGQKMTQEALAGLLGYTPEMVCMIENGKARPSLAKLLEIQKVTGGQVTADDFLVEEVD